MLGSKAESPLVVFRPVGNSATRFAALLSDEAIIGPSARDVSCTLAIWA